MKKWWRVLLCAVMAGQWQVAQLHAQEQSQSRAAQASEETVQSSFLAELQQLNELEQYEIHYELSNIRNRQTMAEVHIIGNQRTGDAHIVLDFYYRNASPNHYRLELLTYNHFDLVYAKQFAFLQSMAFFKQGQFPAAMHDEMAQYNDYYVALDAGKINTAIDLSQWVNLLQVLPNEKKLSEIPENQFYQIGEKTFLALEKLAIPEYLFENESFIALDYQWALNILREKSVDGQWQVQSTPKIQVAKAHANTSFKVRVDAELESLPHVQSSAMVLEHPHFERSMQLDGTDIANKLKKIQLFYDRERQLYQATLEGVTENVNWNLLSEGTTVLKSYDFKVVYSIRPTAKEVPTMFEVERMTQSEFDYIIENYLEAKETDNGSE